VSLYSSVRNTGSLPVEGHLPEFEGATGWLNSPPLTTLDLRGKVVFPFERNVDNVRRPATDMRVAYPIAVDSDYAVWEAFANRYWPAVYIADAQGQIRHHHFGEGGYGECEMVIRRLLRESRRDGVPNDAAPVVAEGFEAQADWANLRSPETYLGYEQGRSFASPGRALDESHTYAEPDALNLNQWALAGCWTIGRRACVLDDADGRIAFRFHARDAQLVMGPRERGTTVPFRVLLDGEPPGDARGLDVDPDGLGLVAEPRLYQLIRQPGSIDDRTLEIGFAISGVEAYVFTFG
jgi:hypothetical protein